MEYQNGQPLLGAPQQGLMAPTSSEFPDVRLQYRADLRFIYVSRHLETPLLLTVEQIARYNELRG
tara:strand:+ start:1308 stop:1502 length:195 start_codon:yes stop_codon:yes gene_type:complete